MKWFQGSGEVILDRASLAQMLCNLGVVLDSWLLLKDQVAAIDRRAFVQLQFMNQLCSFLDLEILLRIHSSLVTSQLDYYNTLYMGSPLKTILKITAECRGSCSLRYTSVCLFFPTATWCFFPWMQFINFFWLPLKPYQDSPWTRLPEGLTLLEDLFSFHQITEGGML